MNELPISEIAIKPQGAGFDVAFSDLHETGGYFCRSLEEALECIRSEVERAGIRGKPAPIHKLAPVVARHGQP